MSSLTLSPLPIGLSPAVSALAGTGHDAPSCPAPRRGQIDLDGLASGWLRPDAGGVGEAVRRCFDLVLSFAALLVALPLLLLVAASVRIDSPGPILYRQERVGLNGRVFTLLKFRSMRVDAEAAGPCWASQADPRVTRTGRLLRVTRFDELPQLFNVLAGSMSLIGPRPERPHFVAQLGEVIPRFADRVTVKPGVTGWAQVNYPYGASIADAREKLAYDLYYITHRSLVLDARILMATVGVMLRGSGAR